MARFFVVQKGSTTPEREKSPLHYFSPCMLFFGMLRILIYGPVEFDTVCALNHKYAFCVVRKNWNIYCEGKTLGYAPSARFYLCLDLLQHGLSII